MNQDDNYTTDRYSIDELMHRSILFSTTAGFFKFINFMLSFEHYSRYNKLLVLAQNESVTFFGSSTYWKNEHDRTIRENARPHVIMAPGGPVLMVYDIFETDGIDSPQELLDKGLGRKPFRTDGFLSRSLYSHAISVAESLGIKIIYKPLSYLKAGDITTAHDPIVKISLKEGQPIEENFPVLLHEIAHLFLGHCMYKELSQGGNKKKILLPQRKLPEPIRELEAETISHLLAAKLGLKKNSDEYLAKYLKSQEVPKQYNYEAVIKAADKIEKLFIDKKLINDWSLDGLQQDEVY
jgi:hypothetical protein